MVRIPNALQAQSERSRLPSHHTASTWCDLCLPFFLHARAADMRSAGEMCGGRRLPLPDHGICNIDAKMTD